MLRFEELSDNFVSWLKAQEGVRISPKIKLADLREQGAGRGVVTTEDVDTDEELFFIPHHAVLSVYTSDISTHFPEIKREESWTALIITMIYECGKGKESKWWPYFNILPEEFDTLMYWSDEELADLKGSAVLGKVHKDLSRKMVTEDILPFIADHRDHFGSHAVAVSGPDAVEYLMPLTNRMGTLIMAYGFDIEKPENPDEADEEGYVSDADDDEPKGMVPMADMLNADGQEKNNARLEHEEEGLKMVAIKHIPKDQECFNNYGPLPRSDLLRRYGYISDKHRSHDVVEISLSQICKVISEKYDITLEELEARQDGDCRGLKKTLENALKKTPGCSWCNFMDENYDIPSVNQDFCFWDPGLIFTVDALAADQKEVRALKKKTIRAPLIPTGSKTQEVLQMVVKNRLKDYTTTIAEDRELLRDTSLPLRKRQAIEVRLGEKEILAGAVSELSTKADTQEDFSSLEGPVRHAGKRRRILEGYDE